MEAVRDQSSPPNEVGRLTQQVRNGKERKEGKYGVGYLEYRQTRYVSRFKLCILSYLISIRI